MAGKNYSNRVIFILLIGDLIFLNLAFIATSYITSRSLSFLPIDQTFSFLVIINLFWSVLAVNSDLYKIDRFVQVHKNMSKAILIVILHYIAVSLILYTTDVFNLSTYRLIIFYIFIFFFLYAGKIILLLMVKYLRKKGANLQTVVILGGGKVGDEIKALIMADYSFGYKYLGTFDDKSSVCQFKSPKAGSLSEFKDFALKNRVDIAFIALPDDAQDMAADLMQFCDDNTIRVKIVPDFNRYIRARIKLDYYGNIPIILLHDEPLESYRNQFLKRAFDIIFSSLIIIFVLSWLIPVLGLFIKLTSKGPIFFTQHRTGLNNKEFYIIKFRTMRLNAEADTMTARKEDPRRTKVGRFLRKTNIDEIPQFINVFLGNMSIIGPRPHMLSETVHYSKIIDSYLVRHFIKPGLTGWAQINGFHGNSVNPTIMRARVKYDVYYIENWSVALDIRIFFITIYDMFRKLYIPYSIKNYNIKRFTVQI